MLYLLFKIKIRLLEFKRHLKINKQDAASNY